MSICKKYSRALSLMVVFLFAVACSTSPIANKTTKLPLYSKAISLRGQTKAAVIKTLGEPADQPQENRAFWFLSDESTYHPDPTPILYEFHFSEKGILETVKKGVQQ